MLRKINAFSLGTVLLTTIIIISIVVPTLMPEPSAEKFRYNFNQRSLDIPPFSPSADNWFGTDRNGKDLFYAIVDGAKYTVFFALVITLLRMLLSFIGGLIFKRLFKNNWVSGLLQGFHYVPQSLIILLVLSPLLFYELRTQSVLNFTETLVIQLVVLVAVGIFPLAKIIAEIADSLTQNDYVTCAKHMGSSSLQITKRHVLPHLWPRLFVLAGRQFSQVLTLMLHLAIYHLFIGGVKITSGQEHDQFNNYSTVSNEWTGLISMYHRELMLEPFIVMIPVVAYTLLILCVNIMTKSLEKRFDQQTIY
ncbi:ABC transporter permease subunit [Fictibacillus sp. b24]|uniref:ABC transporter permease n=1 Tax=Fictibacillus sp. b24 TaxID=3055863 RepID=UPI0025A30AA5|nr:ABC transporter permease subunit [Fictibacillus sp. b24]MDM5317922.1 ABC transporter permease subunit [Fictibacillus sp. b24]